MLLKNGKFYFLSVMIFKGQSFQRIFLEEINIGIPTVEKWNKNKAGGITLPDFKLYYKAVIIRTVWYWHKKRHTGQWNRIRSLEINPHIYGQLVYDKGAKNTHWRNDNLFSKWWWKKRTATCKKWKQTTILHYTQQLTQNGFKYLKVRSETIKILGENVDSTLFHIGLRNVSVDLIPKARKTKANNNNNNKLDYTKTKSFHIEKENIIKTKWQPTEWKKIFANHMSDRG